MVVYVQFCVYSRSCDRFQVQGYYFMACVTALDIPVLAPMVWCQARCAILQEPLGWWCGRLLV